VVLFRSSEALLVSFVQRFWEIVDLIPNIGVVVARLPQGFELKFNV
jgi:hypothetical protein